MRVTVRARASAREREKRFSARGRDESDGRRARA